MRRFLDPTSPWFALGILVLVFLCTEPTPLEIRIDGLPLDIWFQDFFYNHDSHAWLVDKSDRLGRLFFYNGPKVLLGIGAGILALSLAIPRTGFAARGWSNFWFSQRRRVMLLLLALATGPILIGILKARTDIYCPDETKRYDGYAPHVRVLESYPAEFKAWQATRPAGTDERGRGWPAGHASGGFAVVVLWFVLQARKARWAGLLGGIALGWWMGSYQILKGAHYLSHTLLTWAICWLLACILARLVLPRPIPDTSQTCGR